MNRETWLNIMLKKLHPYFKDCGYLVPDNIRISVGFPSKGIKSKTIGECWDMECSHDKQFEIFIHPNQDDAIKVTGILIHEICHTIAGIEAKHGPEFKELASKVGLVGKMKATEESPELILVIQNLLKEMAEPYPHQKLTPRAKPESPKNTSVIKLSCPKDGYIVRTSKKWVEKLGYPTCPCGEDLGEGESDPETVGV
jgi:hypothetical protein